MKTFSNPNFISTFSDLLTNLSAGWFGAVLIRPGIWTSSDLVSNVIKLLNSILYGTVCFYLSYYLKTKSYGN